MDSLFSAGMLGLFGGLIGAVFIRINNKVNVYRKRFLKKKWMKVAEAIFMAILTSTAFYLASYIRYASASNPDDPNDTSIC